MRNLHFQLFMLLFLPFLAQAQIDSARLLSRVRILSTDSMQGRETGTAGIAMAREFIKGQFIQSGAPGFVPDYEQRFEFIKGPDTLTAVNLVAYVEGERPEQIVISAHYDHVGIRENKIYNGADDNASGVAALLELVDYFSENKPEYTLVFCAFDAEEMGLVGAKYFVNSASVDLDTVLININMDMLSRGDKGELYASGLFHYPDWKAYVVPAESDEFSLKFGHDNPKRPKDDWSNASDHAVFFRQDVPFIYFGVEDHEDYHKPTDDFDKINPDFLVYATQTVLNTIMEINQKYDVNKRK